MLLHTLTHAHTHKYTSGVVLEMTEIKKTDSHLNVNMRGDVLKVHLKFLAAFHFISECLGLAPLKAKGNKSSLLLAPRPL